MDEPCASPRSRRDRVIAGDDDQRGGVASRCGRHRRRERSRNASLSPACVAGIAEISRKDRRSVTGHDPVVPW